MRSKLLRGKTLLSACLLLVLLLGEVASAVITRRKLAVESGNITTSKRASKLPLKWRSPVPPLKKYSYPHLSEARKLKQYVLSKDGLEKYSG